MTRASTHVRALADAYPGTDGHTLVVPIRHVPSLFDLPADELADIWRLVGEVRAVLAASLGPHGFTTGVNDGETAGQTVMQDEWRERAEIRPQKNEEWARPEPTTIHALRARTTLGRFGAHSAVNAPLYPAAVSPVDS